MKEKIKGWARKAGKYFNVFDLVLLAAAAVIAAVLLAAPLFKGDEMVTVRFTVETSGYENGDEKLIKVGDKAMDSIKKYDMGVIKSVSCEPTVRQVIDYDSARVLNAEVPGQMTALVVFEAKAKVTDMAIAVDGGLELRVGDTVSVKTPGISFSGYVVEIERGEAQ